MKRSTLQCFQKVVQTTLAVCFFSGAALAAEHANQPSQQGIASESSVASGAELFAREWIPGDERSHGGDGLGPLFNDSSCVACHNQGGNGGAGPQSKNVDIITAFELPVHLPMQQQQERVQPTVVSQVITSIFGDLDGPAPVSQDIVVDRAALKKAREEEILAMKKRNREQLTTVHPGFSQGNSIVLHSNATFAGYREWRSQMTSGQITPANTSQFLLFNAGKDDQSRPPRTSHLNRSRNFAVGQQFGSTMQTRFGNFTISRSQRNATALFGAGLIDSVKQETLEALAAEQAKDGEVSGRVALLADKKIGRFGWKGQTASLRDFVLTACAVEVGLNVPNHPQSGLPQSPEYRPTGLDLNDDQCNALVNYVSSLPAPSQRELPTELDKTYVHGGAALFASIGCAKCHVENVGDVQGLFSDLLLHDMGDELGDSGSSYGVFLPDSTPDGQLLPEMTNVEGQPKDIIGATRKEWRTPALWGVRDSAPYLHDGRAADLMEVIALHGGESLKSANSFFALSDSQQFQVITFMKSLVAPTAEAQARQLVSSK